MIFPTNRKQLKTILIKHWFHLIVFSLLFFDLCILLTEHIVLIIRFHKLEQSCKIGEVEEAPWIGITETGLRYATLVVVSLFMLELLLKIIGFGRIYFKSIWNWIDFCAIVTAFVCEVALPALLGDIAHLVLPFRIIRLVRLTHVIVDLDHEELKEPVVVVAQ